MSETSRGAQFEKEVSKENQMLPLELQGIELSPDNFAKKEGEQFQKVVLGHLDMDTLASYCIARNSGFVAAETPVEVKQRTKEDDISSPDVLTVEVQGEKIPSIKELHALKKQMRGFGLDTTAIDEKINILKTSKATPEQYNASLGNITHTGEQRFTAAAQLFALAGSKPEYQNLALMIQQSEETRSFKKKKKKEGRSFNQLADQIIKKYTPTKGKMPPEDLQTLLNEVYDVFSYVKDSGLEFTDNIPLDKPATTSQESQKLFDNTKDRFAEYFATMQAEAEKRKEELQGLELLASKETPSGTRIALFDGQKVEAKGVFGKINQMTDDTGRRLSDVTVLIGKSPKEGHHQVKIALHKSLEGQIDLAPIAMFLNLQQVLKGDLKLESGTEEFGGHTNKFIGTPRRQGTTIPPQEIYNLLFEYLEEEHHTEEELLEFAKNFEFEKDGEKQIGLKGARVVYVPGTGEYGIPERALQFVDVESSSLSPELYESGAYGEKLKTVRESQIDFEQQKILTEQELVENYFASNQVEKALKVAMNLPQKEAFDILSKPSFQDKLFTALTNNPAFAKMIYCPEESHYFDLPAASYPNWATSPEDKATFRFMNGSSASHYVDTYALTSQEMRTISNPEVYLESLQQILLSKPIRESFSADHIYGHLLEKVTAFATRTNPNFFRRERENPVYSRLLIDPAISDEISAFIANKLSTAEVRYISILLNERESLLKGQKLKEFSKEKDKLMELIGHREDFKEFALDKPYPNVSIEIQDPPDIENRRKILTLEVGRHSNLRQNLQELLAKDRFDDKESIDASFKRNGFVTNPSEQSYIVGQLVEAVLNINSREPDSKFEIYVQAPIDMVASLAYQLGQKNIDIRFGQWKQNRYVLSRSPETVEES